MSGGKYYNDNAAVIAVEGRWVLYGLMGGAAVEGPVLALLLRKRIRLVVLCVPRPPKALLQGALCACAVHHEHSGVGVGPACDALCQARGDHAPHPQ